MGEERSVTSEQAKEWADSPEGQESMRRTCERAAAMTDEQIEAAAWADPDAHPLTEEDLKHMRRTPLVRTTRRALSLSLEGFAARSGLPYQTLLDWETGRTEPDETQQAYLRSLWPDDPKSKNPR